MTPAEAPEHRKTGRRRAAGVLVLAAASLAAAVFGTSPPLPTDVLRPPDRFSPRTPGEVNTFGPAEVGQTFYVFIAYSDTEVTVDDAELVVDGASPLAAVELVACQGRSGAGWIGSVEDVPLSDFCASVEDPRGASIGGPMDGEETYLLAVVELIEAGRFFIDGVKVTHSRGPFHRTEYTGAGVELSVT